MKKTLINVIQGIAGQARNDTVMTALEVPAMAGLTRNPLWKCLSLRA
jgi:hypothetical protein